MSKRKEKLKKIADQKGTEDYSAKADYIKKGGLMGKGDLYKNERVTINVKGSNRVLTTQDTNPKTGNPTYPNAKTWYNNVLMNNTIRPSFGNAKGFMFNGKIYGNPTSKGAEAPLRKA